MRVLITGAGGFVGAHLAAHIRRSSPRAQIIGTQFHASERMCPALDRAVQLDLRNQAAVRGLLESSQPDVIYHLAAQAFVPRSFEAPWETLENNIRAQLNIIRGCIKLGLCPRMLVVSSAEIYGAVEPEALPIGEDCAIRPTNPYSVSKVAQDMLGLQYFLSHGLPIMRARPFNHIGPGQNERFVAPAFAMQIARIEAGLGEPVLYVGNLAAKRDFTDVRDIVAAYCAIIAKGQPGAAYNVASGQAHSIRQLLDTMLKHSRCAIEVRVDSARLRPVDLAEIRGDACSLERDTGWQPSIPFARTLRDVLEDCRRRVQRNEGQTKT